MKLESVRRRLRADIQIAEREYQRARAKKHYADRDFYAGLLCAYKHALFLLHEVPL